MGSLLVDRHRPTSLAGLHYHQALSDRLAALVSTDFPHTLFYGPSGAGKKTRIMCVLKELFGPGVEKIRIEQRVFVTPSKRKIDLNIVQSNYHIELTPSDAGMYDRAIISDILKEIAQTQQVDLNAKKRFKVVIINEADLLSRDAQSALRRTMEKYTANLRIILCANSTSKIIGPIRSRCLLLRVGAPSEDEIVKVLTHVSKLERLSLPADVAATLAASSGGNLRRALLSLEALSVIAPSFNLPPAKGKDDIGIPRPDWEVYLDKMAGRILGDQTPERLLEVRGMLYEVLTHCIPASVIIVTLSRNLTESVAEDLKGEVVYWAAFYEHRLRLGSKAIFHLEGFVAKIMGLCKQHALGLLEASH